MRILGLEILLGSYYDQDQETARKIADRCMDRGFKLGDAHDTIREHKKVNEILRDELGELRRKVESKEAKLKDAERRIENLVGGVTKYRADFAAKSNDHRRTVEAYNSLKQSADKLEIQNRILGERLSVWESANKNLFERVKNALNGRKFWHAEAIKYRTDYQDKASQLTRACEAYDALKECADKLAKENAGRRRNSELLNESVNKERDSLIANLASMANERNAMADKLKEAEHLEKSLFEGLEEMTKQRDALKKDLEQSEANCSPLGKGCTALRADVDTLASQLRAAKADHDVLVTSIKTLQRQRDALEQSRFTLKNALQKLLAASRRFKPCAQRNTAEGLAEVVLAGN